MERERTTTRPSKDLVRPSTSMATSDVGGPMSEDGGRMSDDGGDASGPTEERGGFADSAGRPVPASDCMLSIISWPPSAKWRRPDEEGRKAGLLNFRLPSVLRHLASVV